MNDRTRFARRVYSSTSRPHITHRPSAHPSPNPLPKQMECLHTFCHACIVKVVQPGKPSNACPKCQIGLGVNPFVEKKIVRDGTKTSIVDRLREGGHFGGVDVTEGTGVGGE